jgi:hypothetical protein
MHWSDNYIGQPYIPEENDCAAFAKRVALEVLGIDVSLPTPHASTIRAQAAQIHAYQETLATRIDAPLEGQPALFLARGRACHIGVMCWRAHEWWVLHADQSAGAVVCQRLRDMTQIKYQLEGFYQWSH